MSNRVISSTLKNLKFMQRAAQKEEKPNKEVEEIKQDGVFVSSSNVTRKCVVIMEGDPHPGTVGGRMSFQNFNPSIDKLNGATVDGNEEEASTSSAFQTGNNLGRQNSSSEHTDINMGDNGSDGKLKRKHPEEASQNSHPNKSKDSKSNKEPSSSENRSRKQKRDKLDFNVLVPPKSQSKRRGG